MQHPEAPSHVILIGPMGSGKSTIGRRVADAIGLPMRDSDDEILRREGRTGAAIADSDGVQRLHAIELDVFLSMVSGADRSVICPAESVVDDAEGLAMLGEHVTFWLHADDDALASRRSQGEHRRAMGDDEFHRRRAARDPRLAEVAQARLNTSTMSVDDCVRTVCRRVDELAGS